MQMVTTVMKLKDTAPWKDNYEQPRQHFKKQSTLPTKVHIVKAVVFPV